MNANATTVSIEAACLIVTAWGLVDAMLDRHRQPIPQSVLDEGWKSLRPDYRRRIDRSIGGLIRRFKVSVDLWIRRHSRGLE